MKLTDIESRARRVLGIETLLPMQHQTSQLSLPARAMLLAPTGSGKTLAFTIALLRSLQAPSVDGLPQAVVIAPTRELTLQIFDTVRALAAPDFKTTAVYGGHSFEDEANSLAAGTDIVAGTPGRILDHINRRRLNLSKIRTLVIDEYDKALELGFENDMKRIVERAQSADTMILTSATAGDVPDFIGKIDTVLDYLDDGETPAPDIEFFTVRSAEADKLKTLGELVKALGDSRVIVFVNHREAAERVDKYLRDTGCRSSLYHGGLEQADRERALILFRNGTANILTATDLASRGLDIEAVDAVINYHLPATAENRIHRIGRTARMGAGGIVYTILGPTENSDTFDYGSEIDIKQIAPLRSGAPVATLFFNAGKHDKISRGDIVGFLIAKGGLNADEVGRIDVKDRCAYVAVPADKARSVVTAVMPHKIKGKRVRVTQLKNR